jgi:hypothetical protein
MGQGCRTEESAEKLGKIDSSDNKFYCNDCWATNRHGISRVVPGMEEPPLESKGAKKKKKKPKPAGAGPAADSDEEEAHILKRPLYNDFEVQFSKGLYIMTLKSLISYILIGL